MPSLSLKKPHTDVGANRIIVSRKGSQEAKAARR